MKTCIAFIIPIVLAVHIHAQERIVASRIDAVTIFPSSVEITRLFSADLAPGTHRLRLRELESAIWQGSIRIRTADTSVMVRHARFEKNYLESPEQKKETSMWEDSLRSLTEARIWIEQQLEVLDGEEALLTDNRKADNLDPEQLRQRLAFYQQELTRIRKERVALLRQVDNARRNIARIDRQLKESKGRQASETGEIALLLEVSRPVSAALELNYVVAQAGWTPQYEVFARSDTSDLHMLYKASIHQHTGYDWKGVKVTLISADPGSGPAPTRLDPLYARFWNLTMDTVAVVDPETYEEQYQIVSNEIAQEWEVSPMAHRFEVPGRINILHGQPYEIPFREMRIPAAWEMVCVPKISPEVGVYATIGGLHDHGFLPGEARLYLDHAYLRTDDFNPYSGEDSLRLYFGSNQSIVVERQTTDFRKDNRLSGQTRLQIGIRTRLYNAGKLPARIRLMDQVPLSTDKSIAVQLLEFGQAAYTPAEGLLSWTIDLPPGAKEERVFSYQVRYPAGRYLRGIW